MKKIAFLLSLFVFCFARTQTPISPVVIKDDLGNTSATIDCNYPLVNGCLNLHSTFPTINSTGNYSVSSEAYKPYLPLDSGTALQANYDDLYAKQIDIPFTFCFFGNFFNQLVIGSNGVLTFDTNQLGKICYPNIQSTNPSSLLPTNAIFGVLNDMFFSNSNDSEIYYNTVGTAPYRKLVVTFYKGRIPGCTTTASSQIVLSETTNDIEIFVENKPAPCSTIKFKEALIGIQNSDGSLGFSPPARNTGVWTAANEAWKFSPSGTPVVPTLTWTNTANEVVGNAQNITVCPQKSDVYTLTASYAVCGTNTLDMTAQFNLNFSQSYPSANDYTKFFCNTNGSQTVNLDDYKSLLTSQNPANFNFSYYLSQSDAQNGTNPQSINQTFSSDTTFYVRVANPSVTNCYRVSALNFKFQNFTILTNSVWICDTNNDNVENNYVMQVLNKQLVPTSFSGTVSYFASQNDAQNNANAVTNLNIITTTTFWIRLDNGQCSAVFGPISVYFNSAPHVNTPIHYTYTTCDIDADQEEPFNWNQIIAPMITTDPGVLVKFYENITDAYLGTAPSITKIKEGNYTVFVRVEDSTGCFSVAEVILNVVFTKVEADEKEIYYCFNGTDDQSIDLSQYAPGMLVSPTIGITIEYYDDNTNAHNRVSPINPIQSITLNGSFVTQSFYVRFTDTTGCYTVRKLTVNMVHPVPNATLFNVCDSQNDNVETANLADFSSQILGTQNGSVAYYTSDPSQGGATNVTNYTLHGNETLYAEITSYGCKASYPINVNLIPTPVLKPANILLTKVCDNNGDGVENYDLTQNQNAIYSGSNSAIFSYYTNYDATTGAYSGPISDPKNFPVPGEADAYAVVQFANSGCYSVANIHVKMEFLPIIKLHNAVLKKCDHEFNLNETFVLSDAIPQNFLQSENGTLLSNFKITYYKTEADANAGLASTQIGTSYIALVSDITLWIRFDSKVTGCFSVAPIQLLTYIPPKAISYTITDICDDNLDGIYEVDLTSHENDYVQVANSQFNYTYYLTYSDLVAGHSIANPSNFSVNPFPQQVLVKVENIAGCNDYVTVNLTLGTKVTLLNSSPFNLEVCDELNDNKETVDLTQYESQIYTGGGAVFEYYPTMLDLNNGTNQITNPSSFDYILNTTSNKIFVKVSVVGFCPNYTEIDISLKKVPIFTLPDYYFCPYNDSTVDVVPDFSSYDIAHYKWIGPDGNVIAIDQPYIKNVTVTGTYTIDVVGNNGCAYSTTFNVKTYEVPIIVDLIPEKNQYTVIATGSKTILYSLDGKNWQTSNIFTNLLTGVYTFYVKFEGENCLGLTKQGLILNLPNVLTPNGDGINDTWVIDNLYVFEGKTTTLEIYDRYGKMIYAQESSRRLSWDGDWGHAKAPTGSYWYVLKTPDSRIFNGWLLLKNRD